MKLVVITISSNIRRNRVKVTVPHPVKDLPKFVIRSIREQAQLK